jgi:hypothetical protein
MGSQARPAPSQIRAAKRWLFENRIRIAAGKQKARLIEPGFVFPNATL